MRIAVITDIHGNLIALDAVLDDIDALGGVDNYWFLGDYCAIGSNPVGVLERITQLPNTVFIRGNTDRYSISNDTPPPYLEDVIGDPQAVERYAQSARNFAWTRGMLTATGWFQWMQSLPLEHRTMLPDGTNVLLVHATPGRDDGIGLSPIDSDQWVQDNFGHCAENLILVGHVHWQHERRFSGKHIVNPGSVGNPTGDRQACYALVEVETEYRVTLREVAYDVQAVIDHIYSVHHPSEDFLLHFYRGLSTPDWYRAMRDT